MHIVILHNQDHDVLEEDPGRDARADVVQVASALQAALFSKGFHVETIVVEDLETLKSQLSARSPELVFNLCESLGADSRGEIAVAQCLEALGMPFTGSDPQALHLALHKVEAKRQLRACGVSTPDFWVVESVEALESLALSYPLIVKPSREDASVGIDFDSVVRDLEHAQQAVEKVLRNFAQPALLEQYIEGREIYVSLLGNQPRQALPLTEIHFGQTFTGRPRIVSYNAKWLTESRECIDSPSGPCQLEPAVEAVLVQTALNAFESIGARDYGRVDFRLSSNEHPYVIDINPNCDLHPHAGFAKAALTAGLTYEDLTSLLVEIATERTHAYSNTLRPRPRTPRQTAVTHRNVFPARSSMRVGARRSRAHSKSS